MWKLHCPKALSSCFPINSHPAMQEKCVVCSHLAPKLGCLVHALQRGVTAESIVPQLVDERLPLLVVVVCLKVRLPLTCCLKQEMQM